MESRTGQVVGHYRLAAVLDAHGDAPVYRAEHVHHKSTAALKLLTDRLSEHPALRHRLRAAVEGLSGLHHPGLVRVTEYVVDGEHLAVALPLVPGESLAAEQARRTEPYPLTEALVRIQPVADALAAAHEAGVWHGALTPSKVMLSPAEAGPRVRLLGTGLARLGLEVEPATVGPTTDPTALAAILVQLLTAPQHFEGDAPAALKRLQLPPAAAPLADVLRRALDPDPAARWPHAGPFAAALQGAAEEAQVTAVPVAPRREPTPPPAPEEPVAPEPTTSAPPRPRSRAEQRSRARLLWSLGAALAMSGVTLLILLVARCPGDRKPSPVPQVTAPHTPGPDAAPAPRRAPDASAPRPPAPTPRPAPPSPLPRTGAEACDRYLRAYRCYADRLGTIGRTAALHVLRRTAAAWKKMVDGPGGRALAEGACAQAFEALARSLSQLPQARGCFGPTTAVPHPPAPPRPAPRLPPPSQDVGVVPCDQYLATLRCYLGKLPGSGRSTALQSVDSVHRSWLQMAAKPGGKASLEPACQNALTTLRRALRGNRAARDCLK